jgi:hypothetical protein
MGITMNKNLLEYIVKNASEKIEKLAIENELEPSISIGIAKNLIGNEGDVLSLSDKQKFHYEKCINPLIEKVPCEGVIGLVEDGNTCWGDNFVDEESLLISYIEDNIQCQQCRSYVDQMK